MCFGMNKLGRMKIPGYCKVCSLKYVFYLPEDKFDENLKPLLTEIEKSDLILNCA